MQGVFNLSYLLNIFPHVSIMTISDLAPMFELFVILAKMNWLRCGLEHRLLKVDMERKVHFVYFNLIKDLNNATSKYDSINYLMILL